MLQFLVGLLVIASAIAAVPNALALAEAWDCFGLGLIDCLGLQFYLLGIKKIPYCYGILAEVAVNYLSIHLSNNIYPIATIAIEPNIKVTIILNINCLN